MQVLYAFRGSESDDFSKDQKFLLYSINNMYNLYLLMLSLLIEIHKKAETHLDKSQKKHLATPEEKDPNRKFLKSEFMCLLRNNEALQGEFEKYKVKNWDLDNEYVDVLFKAIISSTLYTEYMKTKTSTFIDDRNFVISIFKDVVAPNDKLYNYLEDKNLTWLDDLPTVNTFIVKAFKKATATISESHFTPQLYKDADDKEFAITLFKKTLLNKTQLTKVISEKTKNWDSERIAAIDHVLLRMAICELQNFPSIPTKVTINEYLEVSKEYSTPKSSIFINGILDKLVKEYQEKGKLNKVGRGLM